MIKNRRVMKKSKYTSFLIIYNPNSSGDSESSSRTLSKKLSKIYKDIPLTLTATEYTGHAEKLAYAHAKKQKRPLIISASGDGGYNEVINGAIRAQLEGSNPICAVMPAGNANDHSRTLQRKSLFQLIKEENIERIDVLKADFRCNEKSIIRYAHSYIGLGLTPAVASELNKTDLNLVKETWLAAKTFFTFRPVEIKLAHKTIIVDSVLFSNISEMAKRLTVAKNAIPNDGKFEVNIFLHKSKRFLLGKIFKASVSSLDDPSQVTEFALTVKEKTKIQIDGELKTIDSMSKLLITSEQKALSTLI